MKTILSIGAHPDDIEIGCGGTELLFKEKGYSIVHLIATSGDQGSLSIPREELRKKRESEAIKSGKILGASAVHFLRLSDGLTGYGIEEKIKMIQIIRSVSPNIIFVHSKSDSFPDHQIIRSLTESSIIAAAGPWYPEAGGSPHQVRKVYGYEVWHPMSSYQIAFDISQTMPQKKEALRCHGSQTSDVNYELAVEGLGLYRGAMTMKGKYAEVFEVVRTEEDF